MDKLTQEGIFNDYPINLLEDDSQAMLNQTMIYSSAQLLYTDKETAIFTFLYNLEEIYCKFGYNNQNGGGGSSVRIHQDTQGLYYNQYDQSSDKMFIRNLNSVTIISNFYSKLLDKETDII